MGRLEPGFSHPWCKASPFFQKLTVETRIQPGPKLCMSYHCQPMWELLLDPIPTHNTCTQLSRSMQLFHTVLFPSDDVSIIRKLTGRDLLMTYTLLFQIFMLPQAIMMLLLKQSNHHRDTTSVGATAQGTSRAWLMTQRRCMRITVWWNRDQLHHGR